MKLLFSAALALLAVLALLAAPAMAHPGHVELVAGHTHSPVELGAAMVTLAVAGLGVGLFLRRRAR